MSIKKAGLIALSLIVLSTLLTAGCVAPSSTRRHNEVTLKPGTAEQQVEAFTNLGAARLMQGDLAGALSELSKAEKLNPNNVEVLSYLGLTYYSRKDFDKAIEYYQKALTLDPSRSEVHNNLGLVYMERKEYDLAKTQFEFCLKDPTYSKPYLPQFNLGLIEEAQERFEEAIKIYRQIIISSPQYAPPFFRLGRISYVKGDYRQAVDFLLNAVRLNTNYTEAYFLLAETYEKLDLKDEAAESYGQVVVLAPNTALALEAQMRARKVLGYQ
ncbi:MAG: tetratricopeptide repeat protein [Deltaproteobacteria bacterium]|jgi:type IV pilus biogenesis/stability protein PilW|nr:tetratricopeptide repeat protein [Deltaproteobacteria bacterium]